MDGIFEWRPDDAQEIYTACAKDYNIDMVSAVYTILPGCAGTAGAREFYVPG